MNQKLLIVGLLVLIVLVSGCVKERITSEDKTIIQECKEGFTKTDYTCQTEKIDFECTGNVEALKGHFICGKFIGNYNKPPLNISFLDNLAETNKTVHVKGKAWDVYTICDKEDIGMMQKPCGSNFIEEVLEIDTIGIIE